MNFYKDYRFLILSDSVNTYGILRSLGEQGYGSDIFSENISYGAHSKYANFIPIQNTEDSRLNEVIIKRLKELETEGTHGILLATSDDMVDYLARNQDLINEYGTALIAKEKTIEIANNKRKTIQWAKKKNIPHPESRFYQNLEEFSRKEGELRYPVLLKPEKTTEFVEKYKKAVILENKQEYFKTCDEIHEHGLSNTPLILQEYIPGGNENLYNSSFFYDRNHQMKGISIGYKIRQYPPNTGTMTAGKIHYLEVLEEYSKKLMDGLDYYGIGAVEFKYDKRDQLFKIIEINPRSVLWNYSATAAGVNLPLMAIKDLKGEKLIMERSVVPIIWLYDSLDLVRYTITNRKNYPENVLSYSQWKKSISGTKVMAIRNYEDIKPWFYFLKETYLKRFTKK